MKRLLWIIMLFTYLFSINSLVHASMMGFFSSDKNIEHSCHGKEIETLKNGDMENDGIAHSKKNQNINCCELIYSSQYNQCEIKLKDIIKSSSFDFLAGIKKNTITNINFYKPYFSLSPGWNFGGKYKKFSDLIGIIVNLS